MGAERIVGNRPGLGSPETARRVLIVDADWLTRWSVQSYLSNRFEIRQATSLSDAVPMLESERYDAVVVSDDLPDQGAVVIEEVARRVNPDVLVIWTVADTTTLNKATNVSIRLEKPFDLSRLAAMLGEARRTPKE